MSDKFRVARVSCVNLETGGCEDCYRKQRRQIEDRKKTEKIEKTGRRHM